jgi:hypothetical protein
MTAIWTRIDDSTYCINLGRALLVAVVFERLGTPGWKIHVGKRALKDKISSLEDAQRVALAFAGKVLKEVQTDYDALLGHGQPPAGEKA